MLLFPRKNDLSFPRSSAFLVILLLFSDSHLTMGLFRRNKLPPAQTETDRLAEIEQAYQVAKAEHIAASEAVNEYRRTHDIPPQFHVRDNALFVPVNGPRSDAELKRLERAERQTLRVRNERMQARAEIRMRMGLTR